MQVLKLTWVPTDQVFAQPKTFEEAIAAATTRVLRAGYRSFNVTVHDDGESFDVSGQVGEVGNGGLKYIKVVSASPGARIHHFAGTGLPGRSKDQRSELQSISGKPPANGWYKGRGRRFSHAADPRKGPYFLVTVNEADEYVGELDLRPALKEAEDKKAEYPLDAALASLSLVDHTGKATFALVLRDDNAPKLRFNQKWNPNEAPRSMQVVYRRPL